jgi:circadian clock protein KaiC
MGELMTSLSEAPAGPLLPKAPTGIQGLDEILTDGDAETAVSVSSQADTWLLLRNVESNGERNRLLFVLKSRGSANSNQVREFVLTDHGVELIDVYVGPAGVMTGSAWLAQETREGDAKLQQQEELRRGIMQGQAQLAVLQDELAAQQAELQRIAGREQRLAADAQAAQSAMAAQRWADPAARNDEAQR